MKGKCLIMGIGIFLRGGTMRRNNSIRISQTNSGTTV